MQRISPFRMMNTLFVGMAISAAYCLAATAILFLVGDGAEIRPFLAAYTTSFKTLFSLGMIVGTALIVFRSQNTIPETIEAAFTKSQLADTDYGKYKKRFRSGRRSITFASEFIIVSFVIFSYCRLPLQRPASDIMIAAACAEYALGVYVGRKLFYAGMMLHSLLDVPVTRNLFKKRELDDIDSYVHIASGLTIVFGYVHLIGFYNGPFLYDSFLGQSIKPLLLVPVVIATPVLLVFIFYPRVVLRKVYGESIDCELQGLQKTLTNEKLTAFERRSYLIEFDKMARDELRYSLQLTLTDLPIGITVLVMALQSLLAK